MNKPIALPGTQKLAEVCEATWPPASRKALGAWVIRDGKGGGNRVSAATEACPSITSRSSKGARKCPPTSAQ